MWFAIRTFVIIFLTILAIWPFLTAGDDVIYTKYVLSYASHYKKWDEMNFTSSLIECGGICGTFLLCTGFNFDKKSTKCTFYQVTQLGIGLQMYINVEEVVEKPKGTL